jgi:hypothetical protein
VADGMRPCRQLGKEENGNEQEVAQRIHEGDSNRPGRAGP